MGYNYCVCGAGRQGIAAIYDLIRYCEAGRILVYDPDSTALIRAIKRLAHLLEPIDFHKLEFISYMTQSIDWSVFNVMLSCASWEANLKLTKFANNNGIPFCDLGGNPDIVFRQEQIETKSAIVPDCGVSPGISNILAAYLARKGYGEIHVRCGGIPAEKLDNEFGYRLTFSAMGLISEYSGRSPVIVNGALTDIPSLSIVEHYGNDYECSPTSNNSLQVIEYLRSLGVHTYDYMTIRYPGHWNLVRGWKAAGFLRGNLVADHALAQTLDENPSLKYDPDIHVDKVLLSVIGSIGEGLLKRVKGFDFTVFADPDTKFSAMELMTSWGITMVAHYMAKNPGKTPQGFSTPERFVDIDWVLGELGKRLPL